MYRYLKSVFPKVDETILLDVLEQSDNNVQKASEKLVDLGYEKRNPILSTRAVAKKKEEEEVTNFFFYRTTYRTIRTLLHVKKLFPQVHDEPTAPTPPPRIKSLEEKNKCTYSFRFSFYI